MVVNKHREAASIVTKTLNELRSRCVAGADIAQLCSDGDTLLEQGLALVYSSAKLEKGIAVPTCISVNNICGHYSPFPEDSVCLQEGDLVKLDLGAHIDGYISTAATSLVVGATAENKARGPPANVTMAAHDCMQAALRLIRPGNTNYMLTEAFQKIAEAYNCRMLEGVLSHQLKQHVIDGNKVVLSKETYDQHVEEFEFAPFECYAIDIFVSTGEGKPKESEIRTTVYQRALDVTYNLKLKASRSFFVELNRRFPTLLFTLRSFTDQRRAKVGVSECLKHNLLYSFPVLTEKVGDLVAHFKSTVLILENDVIIANPLVFNPECDEAEMRVEEPEVRELLDTPLSTYYVPKAKKNKKKKKKTDNN